METLSAPVVRTGSAVGGAQPDGAEEVCVLRQLRHNGARARQVPGDLTPLGLKADGVTEDICHNPLGDAVLHRPGGAHPARPAKLVEGLPGFPLALGAAGWREQRGTPDVPPP